MNEITLRLSNLETILTNEEKIYIAYQKEVSGEELLGRVDYGIKGNEDLMYIAEGKPRNWLPPEYYAT
ncbi:hypothetical protein Glove_423g78 [Diversispora epigaea]|uniref:Uncharacterized protein n=1 Tax=Diversispora epigaea TaxID=1348612 RepID=A0A397GWU0_9GLOM|nr:hypothetical protein Glove_423g78 [Diversispora epigaea]